MCLNAFFGFLAVAYLTVSKLTVSLKQIYFFHFLYLASAFNRTRWLFNIVCCLLLLCDVTGAYITLPGLWRLVFPLIKYFCASYVHFAFSQLVYFQNWLSVYYSGKLHKVNKLLCTRILLVKAKYWLRHKLYILHSIFFSCLSVSKHGVSKTVKKREIF